MAEQATASAIQDAEVEFSVDAIVLGSESAARLGVSSGTVAEPGSELWQRHQALVFGMSEGNGGW